MYYSSTKEKLVKSAVYAPSMGTHCPAAKLRMPNKASQSQHTQ